MIEGDQLLSDVTLPSTVQEFHGDCPWASAKFKLRKLGTNDSLVFMF